MASTIVRIPTPLRNYTNGDGEVAVEGATVAEALTVLGQRHVGILERVLDPEGRIRGFVNIYVGEDNVKTLRGLETELPDASVITIVPAVAGGGS